MRHALVLLPLLALAACATPRESCVGDVTRDLQALDRQIAQSREVLATGFTTETRRRFGFVDATCTRRTEEGEILRYDCVETGWIEEPVRVAINRPAEEAKLAALVAQRAGLERQAQPLVAACVAAHPE